MVRWHVSALWRGFKKFYSPTNELFRGRPKRKGHIGFDALQGDGSPVTRKALRGDYFAGAAVGVFDEVSEGSQAGCSLTNQGGSPSTFQRRSKKLSAGPRVDQHDHRQIRNLFSLRPDCLGFFPPLLSVEQRLVRPNEEVNYVDDLAEQPAALN